MGKYNVTGLPWSIGTGVSVEDCHTAKEVMEKAKLDFHVKKCELVAKMPFTTFGDNTVNNTMGDFAHMGNIYRACPNGYATYRTDKNVPLGIVKSKYEVVQNIDAFNFFDDAIGVDKAIWQTAGYLGYGERIFVTAKLPINTRVNGDPIDHYLVFSNSHDGSSSINIMFTPIRVFCTNLLNAARRSADSYIRIRHTVSAKEKLQTGAEILRIACQYATSATELYNSLYNIKVSDDTVMKYLADIALSEEEKHKLNIVDAEHGYKRLMNREYYILEETQISTRKTNQIVNMFEYYLDGVAQQHITGTAWGAYNAVTGFYSNVANLSGEKRMDSLLYGSANANMQKALLSGLELAAA